MKTFKGAKNHNFLELDCSYCQLSEICRNTATGCNSLAELLNINKKEIKNANYFVYEPIENKRKRRF